MNYYGTPQHTNRLKDYENRIFSKPLPETPTSEYQINEEYSVQTYHLIDESTIKPMYAPDSGNINRLFRNGELVFEWKYLLDHERSARIIHHANGMDYLLFFEYLFGYSVLDLSSMKSVHYIPQESGDYDQEDFEETVIWVNPHYDPGSNLLAVEGCVWAAPYTVLVLDFSDPMKIVEAKEWLDLAGNINSRIYKGHDFVSWTDDALDCKKHIFGESNEIVKYSKKELKEKLASLLIPSVEKKPTFIVHCGEGLDFSSRNYSGTLWIETENGAFPSEGWDDFPEVVLGWWVAALKSVYLDTKHSYDFLFMDGPYSMKCRNDGDKCILSFYHEKKKEMPDVITTLAEMKSGLNKALDTLLRRLSLAGHIEHIGPIQRLMMDLSVVQSNNKATGN